MADGNQRYRFAVTSPSAKVLPQVNPSVPMVDVPVQLILASIKGAAQGRFAPEWTLSSQDRTGTALEHQFALNELSFGVDNSLDQASGAPRRKMFEPVALLKATGGTTPQFYRALASNEKLTTAIFDCYGQDKSGKLVLAAAVKLTEATVASVTFDMLDMRKHEHAAEPIRDRISLVFQQVEVTFASKTFLDSWS